MTALPSPQALQLFLLVAEELHFGRAAQRARIAQPALSQHIRRLEKCVGCTLFDRTSRRVTLTPPGEAFVETARRVLDGLQAGVQTAQLMAEGGIGQLRIGYSVSAMLTVLPTIIRRFRTSHPRVRLSLREISSAMQIEALGLGDLDVAFVTGGPADHQWTQPSAYWTDRFAIAVPIQHPLARRRALRPNVRSELIRDPLVLFPREQAPALFDRAVSLWASLGGPPEVAQQAQSWHMSLALVAAGVGVSVVPRCTTRLRVAGIRLIDVKSSKTEAGITMFARSSATKPLVQAFSDIARRVSWP